jgi:hypothetical protein
MLKLVIMSLKKLGGSLAPENTDSVRPSMASSAFWSFVKPEQWQPGQIEKKYIYLESQVAGKNGALTKVAVLHATFPKVDFFDFHFLHTIVFVCASLSCIVTLLMHEFYVPLQ